MTIPDGALLEDSDRPPRLIQRPNVCRPREELTAPLDRRDAREMPRSGGDTCVVNERARSAAVGDPAILRIPAEECEGAPEGSLLADRSIKL